MVNPGITNSTGPNGYFYGGGNSFSFNNSTGFGGGVAGGSSSNNDYNMGAGAQSGGSVVGAPGMGVGVPSTGSGVGASGGSSGLGLGAPSMGAGAPGGGSGVPPPPCCFTGYSTVKVMSMDILDCTHFTSFYDVDKLKGVAPMDWSYGLKFSYSVPDMGCERCTKSGGSCGFDVETEALLCLCPGANNSTRQCGNDIDASTHWMPSIILQAFIMCLGVLLC